MTKQRSKRVRKDENLQPLNITEDFWMYAEKKGLHVCVQAHAPGVITQLVPWAKIKRALAIRPIPKPRKAKRK
jgi:hypothetical protein